jgi:hypothetical protein
MFHSWVSHWVPHFFVLFTSTFRSSCDTQISLRQTGEDVLRLFLWLWSGLVLIQWGWCRAEKPRAVLGEQRNWVRILVSRWFEAIKTAFGWDLCFRNLWLWTVRTNTDFVVQSVDWPDLRIQHTLMGDMDCRLCSRVVYGVFSPSLQRSRTPSTTQTTRENWNSSTMTCHRHYRHQGGTLAACRPLVNARNTYDGTIFYRFFACDEGADVRSTSAIVLQMIELRCFHSKQRAFPLAVPFPSRTNGNNTKY